MAGRRQGQRDRARGQAAERQRRPEPDRAREAARQRKRRQRERERLGRAYLTVGLPICRWVGQLQGKAAWREMEAVR